MDENSKIFSFDSRSIQEILTLRYDTTLTSNLPKLTWKDFESKNDNISLDLIEKLITNEITRQISSEDSKISLALSGGVDSTLVLALIRKKFPKISIEAISIKFADSLDETETASKVAEHFDANHSVIFLENFLLELPKAISIINRAAAQQSGFARFQPKRARDDTVFFPLVVIGRYLALDKGTHAIAKDFMIGRIDRALGHR